jgi:hypothetical protein
MRPQGRSGPGWWSESLVLQGFGLASVGSGRGSVGVASEGVGCILSAVPVFQLVISGGMIVLRVCICRELVMDHWVHLG